MNKKIIVTAAVLALAAQSVSAAEFWDCNNHWANVSINKLADKGIINGYEDGSFKPDGEVTRAQYLKMMMEAVGIPTVEYREDECLDASWNDWYAPYLQSALDKGLIPQNMIVGYKANISIDRDESGASVDSSIKYSGAFNGNVSISREEAAYFTMALCQYSLNANTMTKLKDANKNVTFTDESDISAWALPSVKLAATNEIITGVGSGAFAPKDTETRAQAAAMIERLLEKLEK